MNQGGYSYSQDRPVYGFLCTITDPFLNLFRSKKFTIGRIDFSTLFAFMVLNIIKTILATFAAYRAISLGIILGVIIQNLWSYVIKYFGILLLILLAVRFFMGRNPYNGRNSMYIPMLDRIIQSPVNLVFKIFYPKKSVGEQQLVLTALIFYAVVLLLLSFGVTQLANLLYKL